MDQADTGGFLHFQLTSMEEVKISISTRRSYLSEECMRAFKSSLRTAWKMGPILRFVDLRIRVFHFKFCSCFQMEWFPFFCFIYGALGLGVNHCAGIKGKFDCLWHFRDWTGENSGLLGVFEKHGADCRGGSVEKRREEVAGVQHALIATCLASLGMEHSID